jgi:hypothetical protein
LYVGGFCLGPERDNVDRQLIPRWIFDPVLKRGTNVPRFFLHDALGGGIKRSLGSNGV